MVPQLIFPFPTILQVINGLTYQHTQDNHSDNKQQATINKTNKTSMNMWWVTSYFTDKTNERRSRKGGTVSHKPSVDHLMGDSEANAPRWKWIIVHWLWCIGHFSFDLLVYEASSLLWGRDGFNGERVTGVYMCGLSLDLQVHEASSLFRGGYGFKEGRRTWESKCVIYILTC